MYKIKLDLHLGDMWLSYFEFLRQSRLLNNSIQYFKLQEDQLKQNNDYSNSLADEMLEVKDRIALDFKVNIQEQQEDAIGLVYSQGDNNNGILGIGSDDILGPARVNTPQFLPMFRNRIVHKIVCGDFHA